MAKQTLLACRLAAMLLYSKLLLLTSVDVSTLFSFGSAAQNGSAQSSLLSGDCVRPK